MAQIHERVRRTKENDCSDYFIDWMVEIARGFLKGVCV